MMILRKMGVEGTLFSYNLEVRIMFLNQQYRVFFVNKHYHFFPEENFFLICQVFSLSIHYTASKALLCFSQHNFQFYLLAKDKEVSPVVKN